MASMCVGQDSATMLLTMISSSHGRELVGGWAHRISLAVPQMYCSLALHHLASDQTTIVLELSAVLDDSEARGKKNRQHRQNDN